MNDRICPVCQQGVEDEVHVLTECDPYNDIREKWINDLLSLDCNIRCMSKNYVLSILLGSNNENIIKINAKACKSILVRRRQLLTSA